MTKYVDPIEVNLRISKDQTGGELRPNLILNNIKNKIYKYLLDENKEKKYKFVYDERLNLKPKYFGHKVVSTYLGIGTFSAVMAIDPIGEKSDQKIVIKMIIGNVKDLKDLITKYTSEKKSYPANIPTIHYYGRIRNHDGKDFEMRLPDNHHDKTMYGINYIIMPLYKIFNRDIVETISFPDRRKILLNLLIFLQKLKDDFIYLYDLKPQNLGYDDDLNCIIIDYDALTLRKYKEGNELVGIDRNFGGTYSPYYVYSLQETMKLPDGSTCPTRLYGNNQYYFLGRFSDKLSVIGLAIFINILFIEDPIPRDNYDKYGPDLEKVHKNIVEIVEKSTCFEKETYKPIFCAVVKEMLADLMNPNYNKIPEFKELADRLTDFMVRKSELKVAKKPILSNSSASSSSAPSYPLSASSSLSSSSALFSLYDPASFRSVSHPLSNSLTPQSLQTHPKYNISKIYDSVVTIFTALKKVTKDQDIANFADNIKTSGLKDIDEIKLNKIKEIISNSNKILEEYLLKIKPQTGAGKSKSRLKLAK